MKFAYNFNYVFIFVPVYLLMALDVNSLVSIDRMTEKFLTPGLVQCIQPIKCSWIFILHLMSTNVIQTDISAKRLTSSFSLINLCSLLI